MTVGGKSFSSLMCLLGGVQVYSGMHWRKSYSNGSSGNNPKSDILFLGTGSSLGTPVAYHLMNPDLSDPRSKVSREAAVGDPRHNKNYRGNPSIMVRHRTRADNGVDIVEKNIVVDVGE